MYQKASGASAAAVDMEGCDLSVKADIQRVQVTLLLAFVGRVKVRAVLGEAALADSLVFGFTIAELCDKVAHAVEAGPEDD